MEAWHFIKADRLTQFAPRQPVTVGQTLKVDPDKLALCKYGLHASTRAVDALKYAPGPVLCRVRPGGRILAGEDKVCASERTVLAMADATDTLRHFARLCALDVIGQWGAPPVVREYLETGREDLRAAAAEAAEAAEATRAAAEATRAAAEATRAAAEATRAATRAPAWAAWAAWAAAEAAEAAWEAAWKAQNARLEAMLTELLNSGRP